MEPMKITDWLQAIGSIITAVTSIALLWQLVLAKKQMSNAHQWNKLNATFTYFSHDMYNKLELDAAEAVQDLGISLATDRSPISSALAEKIFSEPAKYIPVKAFLNLLEDYATAVNVKVFEEECAYSVMSGIMARYWVVLSPLVLVVRSRMGETYFPEFESLSSLWTERLKKEAAGRLAGQVAPAVFKP